MQRSSRAVRARLVLMVALALWGACSVDSVTFTGVVDGSEAADTVAPIDTSTGPIAIVVSSTDITVTEGTTKTFTVMLSAQPAQPVLVNLASSDDTKLGLTPTALLFSTTNWNVGQTVTLSGKQDADTVDESVTVSLTSTDAPGVDVAVTVDDDDGLAVKVSPTSLDVTEGASAPLAVRLTAQPVADVTVSVTSDNPAAATLTPATLTFTASNWSIDQTVTVSGVMDTNVVTDTANLAFSSPALTTVTVPVQVVDKDQVSIQPSTSALALGEGGSTTFTVTLTQQPTGTTTVTLASSDVGAATVAPATLTFTTGNWNVAQTVTVTAPQDVDTANEAVSLTLAATGLTTRTVSVGVTDDDTQVIVATPSPVTMNENGTATVNVHLAFKPATDVVVATSTLSNMVATVTPAQLTFSPSSYASDQALTLTAPDDPDADPGSTTLHLESVAAALVTDVPVGVVDDDHLTIDTTVPSVSLTEGGSATFGVKLGAQPPATVTVAVLSSDVGAATASPATLTFTTGNWNTAQLVTVAGVQDIDLNDETLNVTLTATGLPAKVVAATVQDDDSQGIVVSATAVTVSEGATGTVGVSLQYMPAAPVTVSVASGDSNVATLAPTSLTFGPSDYDTPQLVTISGVVDPDAVDGATTLSLSATGLTTRTVAVTVTDIDHLGLESSVPSLSVNEGGAAGTVGVRLTAQPSASTTVTIVSSDTGAATATPASLTFTTVNWHTFQNVTVTGVQDPDAADESVTVTASATGLTSLPIPVTVVDDEVLGIVTDVPSVSLAEGGTTSFQVRLAAQPAGNTAVTVVSQDPGAAIVSTASLTFTTSNWNTYQTVTVTGVQDVDLADETVTITLASGGFPNKLVTAAVTDDDSQVVVASAGTVAVTEGATATVGVSLQYMPASNVVVSVASNDGTVATATPGSLTFTPTNYATAQTVTVSGTQDADAAPNATTLTMSASGATPATVNVNVTDDDTLGIVTSTGSVTIGEAGSATVGVKLSAQPLANTTVAIASSDTGAATVTSSLTFTPSNWNSFQNLTVSGVNDADVVDESVTLTLSSSGLASKTVAVTVTDDDTLGIVATPQTVTLGEAGSTTFAVKLSAQPQANVVVAVTSSDTGAATVDKSSLTFTSVNWSTAQVVTVSGVADQDLADESVQIKLASTGLPDVPVSATVNDDDTQAVLVSSGTLGVNEGFSSTFTVTLRYIPSASTSITVASDTPLAATVSPSTLVFDATNYSMPQTVTVTGVQDADAVDASATVNLTAPSTTPGAVAVTVKDDDTLGIETNAINAGVKDSVGVTEGSTATFGIRLTAQPLTTTTVNIASSDGTIATSSPASLSFTPSNWNSYQTVTVAGTQDQNVVTNTTTIKLTATGLADKLVSAVVSDDDTQVVQLNPNPLAMTEGTTATFSVSLKYDPGSVVSVTVSSNNTTVATVNPTVLTFSSANYAMTQDVTVTAVQDNDINPGTTMINVVQGAAVGFETVNVTDDDFVPTVPALARPMNGAYVGSALVGGTRHPKFSWRPSTVQGTQGITYDLQYSTDKTFASGVVTIGAIAATGFQPASDLPINTSTVPKGTRYYWRVRACSGPATGACSAFSAPYLLNLGRSDHDFNGDGFADLVVAGDTETVGGVSQAGKVYIYFGPQLSAATAKKITGTYANDFFGSRMATGDFNGDGFTDLAIGVAGDDAVVPGGGKAVVYLGSASFDTTPDFLVHGSVMSDQCGSSVALADFNNDGFDDLVVGMVGYDHGSDTDVGRVDVYNGGAVVDTSSDTTYFGAPSARIGGSVGASDTNGDGFSDLAFTSTDYVSYTGTVYLGGPGGPSPTAVATLGAATQAVQSGGDVNGDGYGELLGAFSTCFTPPCPTTVTVFMGKATGPGTGITLTQPSADSGTAWGNGRDAVGDVNNDGFDDIAVGGTSMWLYLGGPGASFDPTVDVQFSAVAGKSVCGGGDVNGDGFADLAGGSPSATSIGTEGVFYGANGALNTVVDLTVSADTVNEGFGDYSSL